MQTDRTEKTCDLFINHEQDRFIGRAMNLFIKVKICAIMRGLKVILGLNSQTRPNALYAETVVGLQLCPYRAKGSVYCLISEFKKRHERMQLQKSNN